MNIHYLRKKNVLQISFFTEILKNSYSKNFFLRKCVYSKKILLSMLVNLQMLVTAMDKAVKSSYLGLC